MFCSSARALHPLSIVVLVGCHASPDRSTTPPSSHIGGGSHANTPPITLHPGTAIVAFRYTDPTGQETAHEVVTDHTRIMHDHGSPTVLCPGGWGMVLDVRAAGLEHDAEFWVWFHDTDPDMVAMTPGAADLGLVGVSQNAIEHGSWVEDPSTAALSITGAGTGWTSGTWQGAVSLPVTFNAPDAPPTGASFDLESITFVAVDTEVPDHPTLAGEPDCGEAPPGDTGDPSSTGDTSPEEACAQGWAPEETDAVSCMAIFDDLCFASEALACTCADCGPDACFSTDTLPTDVDCVTW
jgi:hypothetical protein